MAISYDFIVVGAGASGSVVASRLANSSAQPSVLLLEAGGTNNETSNLSAAARFQVAFSPNSPLNWNYKTIPQGQLSGQSIDYSRGKGLGGSTAINFCGWLVGPRDDYDEWAELVGDQSFNWSNARRCLAKIGRLHPEIPDQRLKEYVNANMEDHSCSGAVDLTYGDSWRPDLSEIFVAAQQSGCIMNPDVNSGDPIGMGMGSVCIHNGQRLTASMAYLSKQHSNLTILSEATVARVVFDNRRAAAVETIDGRSFRAGKEIVLCGGALNTPQILMLSGIGPEEQLRRHNINVVHPLEDVGRNLQDHCFSSIGISPTPMGWFKSPALLSSVEFAKLPSRTKVFLQAPTIPHFEVATHIPASNLSYTTPPDCSFLGAMCLIMNPQSKGTVTLRSSSPADAPFIDPKFLTHPFDRQVLIQGVRKIMDILSAPIFAAKTIERLGPKDESDEAIWEYIQGNLFSSWHMSCTARMGTGGEAACVDTKFRVFGVKGLRVADMSVCPFVPNTHTQSTAYIIGEMAAEKLIAEYALEKASEIARL